MNQSHKLASAGESSTSKHHDFLKTKMKIGSSSYPKSYHINQSAFDDNDISRRVKERKSEVLEWKSSKTLRLDYKPWNKSTETDRHVCESRTMVGEWFRIELKLQENHVMDRSGNYTYNYRSETLDSLRNIEPIDKNTKFHISSQFPSTVQTLKTLRDSNTVLAGNQKRVQEMPIHPNLEGIRSMRKES